MKREFITDNEKGNNLHLDCRRYGLQVKSYDFYIPDVGYVSIKVYDYENQVYIFKMKNGDVLNCLILGD